MGEVAKYRNGKAHENDISEDGKYFVVNSKFVSTDGKVKKLVLLGATRDKIAETARAHGFEDIEMADTFEEAVAKCVENAKPGDAVLLSPACASWGMFKNYEERGDKFKELVNNL